MDSDGITAGWTPHEMRMARSRHIRIVVLSAEFWVAFLRAHVHVSLRSCFRLALLMGIMGESAHSPWTKGTPLPIIEAISADPSLAESKKVDVSLMEKGHRTTFSRSRFEMQDKPDDVPEWDYIPGGEEAYRKVHLQTSAAISVFVVFWFLVNAPASRPGRLDAIADRLAGLASRLAGPSFTWTAEAWRADLAHGPYGRQAKWTRPRMLRYAAGLIVYAAPRYRATDLALRLRRITTALFWRCLLSDTVAGLLAGGLLGGTATAIWQQSGFAAAATYLTTGAPATAWGIRWLRGRHQPEKQISVGEDGPR